MLSANPNAIELLKQNKDRINWEMASSNKHIKELLEYFARPMHLDVGDDGYEEAYEETFLDTFSKLDFKKLDKKHLI